MRRYHTRPDIVSYPGPRYGGVGEASPEPQASNAGAVRDPVTGRYAFSGDLSRLCKCGHALGVHTHGGFDCLNDDRDAPGADGSPCNCTKFRPAALSTPQPQTRERDTVSYSAGFEAGGRIERERGNALEELLEAERTAREAAERARDAALRKADVDAESFEFWHREAKEQTRRAEAAEVRVREQQQAMEEDDGMVAEQVTRAEAAERSLAEVEERARIAMAHMPHLMDEVKRVADLVTMNNLGYYLQQMDAALRAKPEAQAIVGKEAGE